MQHRHRHPGFWLPNRKPLLPLEVDWDNADSSGLKGFWYFDGPNARDLAFGHALTPTAVAPTTTPAGSGGSFNGTSSKLVGPTDTFYDAVGVTVIASITPISLVQFAPLVMRWNESATARCWSMVMNSTSGDIRVDWSTDGSGDSNVITATGALAVGRRNIIGFTGKPGTPNLNVFVDGISKGSAGSNNVTFALTGTNNAVTVGWSNAWGGAARFGNIKVDFVAIFAKSKTAGEMFRLMTAPYSVLQPIARKLSTPLYVPPGKQYAVSIGG